MKPLPPIGKRRIPMRAVVESLVVVTLLVIVAVVAVQFQDAPSGIEVIESGYREKIYRKGAAEDTGCGRYY